MPYIAGSVVMIVFLIEIIRAILRPESRINGHYSFQKYASHIVIFAIMIGLGEVVQAYLFTTNPTVFDGTFGTALMLGLSYISLFLLLDFFLLLASMLGGKTDMETLACGSLTIWLVIIIMKANFGVWTVGYWVAEGVLAASVAVFPIILLFYYISENERATLMESNMAIYSRFVTEQIRSHHHEAINSLETMVQESGFDDKRLDSISKTLQEVSLAEELTRNMCSVLENGRFAEEALEPLDLVDAIIIAMERLIQDKESLPQIKINRERGACYVIANSLLIDTFEKLLEGVSRHIGIIRTLDISISQEASDVQPSWHTTFTIEAVTQDVRKSEFLFEKYTLGAWETIPSFAFTYRLVKLFNGKISIRSIVGASTQLWLEIKVRLPSTPSI